MRYLGGKSRLVKHIVPIMLAARKPGQLWVEPFVGGGSVFEAVENPRLGGDLNQYVIALLKAVRDGWVPPSNVDEGMYRIVKANPEKFPPHMVGFVGLGASFGAKWFGGYARGANRGGERNFADEMKRALLKAAPGLQGAMMMHASYDALPIPPGRHIFYCDPPYFGASEYKDKKFDTYQFWDWCEDRVKDGHTVFVSEYTPPPAMYRHFWTEVWSGQVPDPLRNLKKSHGRSIEDKPRPTERLFVRGLHHTKEPSSPGKRMQAVLGKSLAEIRKATAAGA